MKGVNFFWATSDTLYEWSNILHLLINKQFPMIWALRTPKPVIRKGWTGFWKNTLEITIFPGDWDWDWWFVGSDESKHEGGMKSVKSGDVDFLSSWEYWDELWQEDKHQTISGRISRSIYLVIIIVYYQGYKQKLGLICQRQMFP